MNSYNTVDAMSDSELIATVIGKRPSDEACIRLAVAFTTDCLYSSGELNGIARECESIGPRSIARLESAVELGRRVLASSAVRRSRQVSTPEDVSAIMRPLLIGHEREFFYALALDTKNRLKKIVQVSVGSLSASIVHPRELFREAISVSAASVIICHGHPSGDPTPSGADIQLTRRLVKAGDIVGIEVMDHVIVGADSSTSMRESGLM